MQAVLFPATYVPELLFDAVKTCFQKVLVYQPTRRHVPDLLQALSRKGLVELRIPVDSDEQKMETLVSGYRNWAGLHAGGALEFLKLQQGSVPFFDDTSIAKIRTDIRRAESGDRSAPPPDPLFNARVFLLMAQEYDLQVEEIARRLAAAHAAERKLFAGITGEANSGPPESQAGRASDLSGRMIEARLTAWRHIFLKDRPAAPAAFIAAHRSVLDFLLEQTPAAEEVLHVRSIPLLDSLSAAYSEWQNRFGRILDTLPEDAEEAAAALVAGLRPVAPVKRTAALKLYRIPGEAPAAFFARCARRSLGAESDREAGGEETLLGWVVTSEGLF